MNRLACLALTAALAGSPGCAHTTANQTKTQRALLTVGALAAGIAVLYVTLGCGQGDLRCDQSDTLSASH